MIINIIHVRQSKSINGLRNIYNGGLLYIITLFIVQLINMIYQVGSTNFNYGTINFYIIQISVFIIAISLMEFITKKVKRVNYT